MPQEIGNFLDGSSLLDESRGQAVPKKVSATALNRDPCTLQSSEYNARDGVAGG
jgi:hypothetical protein